MPGDWEAVFWPWQLDLWCHHEIASEHGGGTDGTGKFENGAEKTADTKNILPQESTSTTSEKSGEEDPANSLKETPDESNMNQPTEYESNMNHRNDSF